MRTPALLLAGLATACAPRLQQVTPRAPIVREIPTPRRLEVEDSSAILLPRPTGPFRVGRATFHAIDPTRAEPFTPDSADHREVLFHLWYPAGAVGGAPAAFVRPVPTDTVFQRYYRYIGVEKLARVTPHALAEAPLAEAASRYPVILFSHGLGAVAAMYTTFLENLASHGYIVVGVDHPFFSTAFQMPDGRIVRNLSRQAFRQRDVITQAADLSFVLNALHLLNARGNQRFHGRLDLEHVGVSGHSRGGFAAPHACRSDNRFRACANLDGWELTPQVMDSGIAQPYMHVEEIAPWEPPPSDSELVVAKQTRAQADEEARIAREEREATFSRMTGGALLVVVAGARHVSFTDQPLIAPERYRDIGIDARRALEITNAYLLAFFTEYLKGVEQPLLTSVPPYEEVIIERYVPGRPKEVLRGGR